MEIAENPFMRFHNPSASRGPAAAERHWKTPGLMDRIAVNIHPRPGAAPGVFERMRPDNTAFLRRGAYEEVRLFTARDEGPPGRDRGFWAPDRCSGSAPSVASGSATASKNARAPP